MTRHLRWTLRLACAALAPSLLLTTAARTQDPGAPPLDALLAQLQRAGGESWKARGAAMQAAVKKAAARAAALRGDAKEREQAAGAETAAGKAILAELAKLEQLRGLVVALSFVDPAGGSGEKAAPQGELERTLAALRQTPANAWKARSEAMRSQASAHDKRAAALRDEHKKLLADATAADAEAKALEAEGKKLQQLQQLVSSLQLKVLAKAAPAAKPAPTKPAAKPAAEPAAPKPAAKPVAKPAPAPSPKPAAKPSEASASPAQMATKDAKPASATKEQLLTYEDHVYPIFDEHCIACHDQGDASGGLDLSSHASTMQGGSSGKTLKPGSPDESRLYLLVSHKEKPTMPPKEARIDMALVETIRTWIAQGAPRDGAQAALLAARRAKAKAKAAAEAEAREEEKIVVQETMPDELPAVAKRFPPRPGAMRALAASPGAPLLAAPGFGQVLLLHQDNLRELGVLDFPFGQVESLSFSADATALVAAGGTPGQAGGAVLFDVRTGAVRGRFGARKDAALTAAVSPRADLVAVGGTRRRVEVFRAADGSSAWRHGHDDWVTATAFSPDGKLIASADRQGSVVVREAANGREVHDFKGADGALTSLAFSPDSSMLATAGADRSVCLFRMRDGRRLFQQRSHSDQTLCLTWRSTSRIVSSGADGRVLTWKTSGSRDPELPRIADWVYGVAASADGGRVFTADWRGSLVALDAKTRKVLGKVTPLAATP